MILLPTDSNAQGCSDAGFCTLSSFSPGKLNDRKSFSNELKLGFTYGKADNYISVFGTYLEYSRKVKNSFGVTAKVTSLGQKGNNVSVFNLSDIYITADYKTGKQTQLSSGIKIPFTTGNKTRNSLPLPLDYQSSLGTFDIIVGIKYTIKSFQLSAALQQPVSQNNNRFIATDYPSGSPLKGFQTTNKFKRSGDVLARLSYFLMISEKVKLSPGLLAIYHLKNDQFTDEAVQEKEIIGSRGLTLNGNLYLDFRVNQKSGLQLSFGSPFITRDARPDGLTRSFVTAIEYKFSF